jgi:carbon storage regulator
MSCDLVRGVSPGIAAYFEMRTSWQNEQIKPYLRRKPYKTSRQKELAMLVLSRQRDESIMIGDDVEITIVDVRGDKVRLGITAPKKIPVHRREIYDAIQREKAEAQAAAQPSEPKTSQPVPGQEKAEDVDKAHQKHA